MVHGDDDQIVPIGAAALRSSKLIKDSTLKVYAGAPHGLADTHKDQSQRRSAGVPGALRPTKASIRLRGARSGSGGAARLSREAGLRADRRALEQPPDEDVREASPRARLSMDGEPPPLPLRQPASSLDGWFRRVVDRERDEIALALDLPLTVGSCQDVDG